MIGFQKYLPEDEDILAAMTPEELAVPLLAALRDQSQPFELTEAVRLQEGMYPGQRRHILFLLADALAYLQREGLVVVYPPELHTYANKEKPWYTVSAAARAMDLPAGLQAYQYSRLLPKELLHPSLLPTVLPMFLRRDYENAVFAAMKQVEMAVRDASKLPDNLVGTTLMRKAFSADQPLGQGFAVDAERQALSDLFAGGMGYYRNTTGHRTVDFTAPEASRVILFASELLNLVQTRRRSGG